MNYRSIVNRVDLIRKVDVMKKKKVIKWLCVLIFAIFLFLPGQTVSAAERTLKIGQTDVVYSLYGSPTYPPLGEVSRVYVWSTDNSDIVSLDDGEDWCEITGKKSGTTYVYCKISLSYTQYDYILNTGRPRYETQHGGTWKITVKDNSVSVRSIDISQSSLNMKRGTTKNLSWTISPSNATNKNVSFYTSNSKVATVSSSGQVKAVGAGKATITVQTSNGKTDVCNVRVSIPKIKSVTLSKSELSLYPGQTYRLKCTIKPSGANKKVSWKSSNKKVATVNSSGLITAKKTGTTYITVKAANGTQKRCKVKVSIPSVKKVKISKSNVSMKQGKTLKLTCTVSPKAASKKVKWSSSNKKVATVNSSGIVTAKKGGTTYITAKAANGKYGRCKVTVKPKPTGVKLSKSAISISGGNSYTLKATKIPSNAYGTITWSSSNSSVATVSSKGVVKAIKAGTAIITAKTVSGQKKTCKVIVPRIKAKSIKLTGSKHMVVGQYETFNATPTPAYATLSKIWSSSNTDVLSVDGNGKVIAKAKGTAVISVKMGKVVSSIKVQVDKKPWVDISKGNIFIKENVVYQSKDNDLYSNELVWRLGYCGVPRSLTLIQSGEVSPYFVDIDYGQEKKLTLYLSGINIELNDSATESVINCDGIGPKTIHAVEGTSNRIVNNSDYASSFGIKNAWNGRLLSIEGDGELYVYSKSGPAIGSDDISISATNLIAETGSKESGVIGSYGKYYTDGINIQSKIVAKGGACALGSPYGKSLNIKGKDNVNYIP